MIKFLILGALCFTALASTKYGAIDVTDIFDVSTEGTLSFMVDLLGGDETEIEWNQAFQRRLGRKIDRLINQMEKVTDVDNEDVDKAEARALNFCVNVFREMRPFTRKLKKAFEGTDFEPVTNYAHQITRWAKNHGRETKNEHCQIYLDEIRDEIANEDYDYIQEKFDGYLADENAFPADADGFMAAISFLMEIILRATAEGSYTGKGYQKYMDKYDGVAYDSWPQASVFWGEAPVPA